MSCFGIFKCCFSVEGPRKSSNFKQETTIIRVKKSPQQQKNRILIGGVILNNSSFKISYNVYNYQFNENPQHQNKLQNESKQQTKQNPLKNTTYTKNVYKQSAVEIQHHTISKKGLQNLRFSKNYLNIIAEDLSHNIVLLLDQSPIEFIGDVQLQILSDLRIQQINFQKLLQLKELKDNQQYENHSQNIKEEDKRSPFQENIRIDQQKVKQNRRDLKFISAQISEKSNEKQNEGRDKSQQSIIEVKPDRSDVYVSSKHKITYKTSKIKEDINNAQNSSKNYSKS